MFVKFDGIPVHSNCNSSESEMLLRIFKGLWLASFVCSCEICFLSYFNYFNVFWQPSMRTNRFLTLLIEQNQEFHYLHLYKKKCLFEKEILWTYFFLRVQYYYLGTAMYLTPLMSMSSKIVLFYPSKNYLKTIQVK